MTWRPPDDLHEDLRVISFHTRLSINEILTAAAREWVERTGRDLAKTAQQKGRKP